MTPPPPGPRDWSPPDSGSPTRSAPSGRRPIRGAGHVDAFGWGVLLAWTSLIIGIASLVIGLLAPLAPDLARMVWISGFAAMAIWAGLLAIPRFRRAGRGRSVLAITGITAGIGTIVVMAYAFAAISLASANIALPAPPHWIGGSVVSSSATSPAAVEPAGEGSTTNSGAIQVPAASSLPSDPIEAERVELAQSIGLATVLIGQRTQADAAWPASLAITTDGTALLLPDGMQLTTIPPGTQVLYSTSSDRREYSLTLIGPSGVTVTFASSTSVIETSIP